jgi:hypothetical protein
MENSIFRKLNRTMESGKSGFLIPAFLLTHSALMKFLQKSGEKSAQLQGRVLLSKGKSREIVVPFNIEE